MHHLLNRAIAFQRRRTHTNPIVFHSCRYFDIPWVSIQSQIIPAFQAHLGLTDTHGLNLHTMKYWDVILPETEGSEIANNVLFIHAFSFRNNSTFPWLKYTSNMGLLLVIIMSLLATSNYVIRVSYSNDMSWKVHCMYWRLLRSSWLAQKSSLPSFSSSMRSETKHAIAPCMRDFSNAAYEQQLQVIARNCDWLIVLSAPVVIGRSNCFGLVLLTGHLKTALLLVVTRE